MGVFFTGVDTVLAIFLSGDCLSLTALVHNRFSFPLTSSKIGVQDEMGFLVICFPLLTCLLEQLPEVISVDSSFRLEALLPREG